MCFLDKKATAPKPEAPKLELPSMSAPQQQSAPPAAGGNWWDGIINADSLTQVRPCACVVDRAVCAFREITGMHSFLTPMRLTCLVCW